MKNENCSGRYVPAQIHLDYTYDTFKILGNERPMFSYSWLSEAAHDDINGGQLVDDSFSDVFTKMYDDGIMDDMAVFFVSDHGMRFDSFRNTPQGRLEDMMPYGFVLMPDRYFEVYPQAREILKINSRRIVTTINFHASPLELADA